MKVQIGLDIIPGEWLFFHKNEQNVQEQSYYSKKKNGTEQDDPSSTQTGMEQERNDWKKGTRTEQEWNDWIKRNEKGTI